MAAGMREWTGGMTFSISNQRVTRCHENILAVMEELGLLRRGVFLVTKESNIFRGAVREKTTKILEEERAFIEEENQREVEVLKYPTIFALGSIRVSSLRILCFIFTTTILPILLLLFGVFMCSPSHE